jgi:NAD(P)-dependent dehydrogenase (short-subunit alcohol dehydrogenase family)
MPTSQQPIDSGFGYRSTAAEVLAGIDLSGARATVVVPARRPAHAAEVLSGIERVEVDELDLGDLDSVRGFAQRMLD